MSKMIKFHNGNMVEYQIYDLVDFYDDVLREPTVPFDFNQSGAIKKAEFIAYSLAETLSKYQGLGISANQVGLRDRVCAINMGAEIWTLFNPEITYKSSTPAPFSEGCLSYPGLYLKIDRPDKIRVKFQAIGGQYTEHEFDGLTAVCIQHEIDHLDGIMFTDRVSPIKFEKAKRKVKSNLKKMSRAVLPETEAS